MKQHLDTSYWIRFFTHNRHNRKEPRWDASIEMHEGARALLEQSLQEFQLGDGGGPASLIAWNVQRYRQSQAGLGEVLDLWFEEEKEHSRLLGGLLKRFEVPAINGHWSFSLFCKLRRWLGVEFELQILTLTELSSTAYYWLLLRHCPDVCVKDVCSLILRDEAGHLAFQRDRLRCAGAPFEGALGWLWRVQFVSCGFAAASVLWISHGAALRAMGVTTAQFYKEAERQFLRFVQGLNMKALQTDAGRAAALA
jgi:hypothetical protein